MTDYIYKFRPKFPLLIHLVESELSLDRTINATITIELDYFTPDLPEFKSKSGFDIQNAIHRNKLEKQLKQNIESNLVVLFTKEFTYQQIKESDYKMDTSLEQALANTTLFQNGLRIQSISIVSTDILAKDEKEILDTMKLSERFKELDDIELTLRVLNPELDDKKPKERKIEWICSCGFVNSTEFCPNCGKPKSLDTWICKCGRTNTTNFCPDCGLSKYEK